MKKTAFFGVLAFAIIFSTLFAGQGNSTVRAASIQFAEVQITTDSSAQQNPDVYGDRIVWQDNRNGNWDIYMYAPGVNMWDPEIRITTSSGNEINPQIYNDIIVYQSDRNGNWDIYMYNITSKVETQITSDPAIQSNPAISGNTIVWQDAKNAVYSIAYRDYIPWEIHTYDIATNTEQTLPLTSNTNFSPAISGTRIAYVKETFWRGEWSGIYYYDPYVYSYDLSTGIETKVSAGETQDNMYLNTVSSPSIAGNIVAWAQTFNVAAQQIGTNIIVWGSAGGDQLNPDISGEDQYKYLVFDDNRAGNPEIYMYELAAQTEDRVTDNPAPQKNPAIFSGTSLTDGYFYNNIVFMDQRNGNWDIYQITFGWVGGPVPPPTPLIPSLVVSQLQMLRDDFADASYIPTSDFSGANSKVQENRRNAITKQLDSVIESIQDAANVKNTRTRIKNCQSAIDQLTGLLAKTDGYTLRETPDTPGSRYTLDWVTGFTSQLYLYQVSSTCIKELQTLLANV